jgi:hypothetical protein
MNVTWTTVQTVQWISNERIYWNGSHECQNNTTLETVQRMSHERAPWNHRSTNSALLTSAGTWPSHTCSGSLDSVRRHSYGRTTSRGWRSSTARPLSSYTPSEWRHEARSDTASPDSGREDSSPDTTYRTKRTTIAKGRMIYLLKNNTRFSNKTPWNEKRHVQDPQYRMSFLHSTRMLIVYLSTNLD